MVITALVFVLLVCLLAGLLVVVMKSSPSHAQEQEGSDSQVVTKSVSEPVSHLRSEVDRFAKIVNTF